MKEFQNWNPILKDNYFNNKYTQNKRAIIHENMKFLDNVPKKNLPELKLTKIKMRQFNSETEHNDNNKITIKTGLNYIPLIPKKKKNILVKKTELMFPKIKNETNNDFYIEKDKNNLIITNYNNNNFYSKRKNLSSKRKKIHSQRIAKNKTLYGTYDVNNLNNHLNDMNIDINSIKNNLNNNYNHINNKINNLKNNNTLQIKNNCDSKINDMEKINLGNYSHTNNFKYVMNLHKIKSKIPRYPRGNKSMPSKIKTKIKGNKKEQIDKNVVVDSLTIKPLINFPKNNNFIESNNNINKDLNNINNNKSNNLIQNTINSSNSLNTINSTKNSLSTANNFTEYDLMTERINILHNLFSSLSSLTGSPNPLLNLNQPQKIVELSPEIFKNTYKNFIPSISSSKDQFSQEDIIKGYAYNSSMGNIRDYNEDTLTATKIIENRDNKNEENFYFFGVYDGHGGNGCSLYLKNNLYKLIKNFSKDAINEAINIAEDKFLKDEALDEKGEIKDQSGSCGIMAMIKKNKCIIANVGDSRLVIYKNNTVFFSTVDHKPGSNIEKDRIMKAGGKIYQTPSLFPLYQNGKEIEIPWRVFPGRLSVSRTFGDVEAKNEKFGGNKNVVVAMPDINEIDLNEDFNLIVLGCDGIFDVLSNEEILECVKIVLKEKNIKEINDNVDISKLCGDFAEMIIKSSLAKDSFDNVSCIVIAINIKDLIN